MDDWMKLVFESIAAVVMAAMFLWYLNKRDIQFQVIISEVIDRVEAMEKGCQANNLQLATTFTATTQENNNRTQAIMADHILVTRETIRVVSELRTVQQANNNVLSELRTAIDAMKVELARKADKHA